MEQITSEQRFREICATGLGVVFNDFSGRAASGAQYNVVHAASCRWLARSNLAVRKFWFEDQQAAASWLVRERGPEGRAWKLCGTCRGQAVTASIPTLHVMPPTIEPSTSRNIPASDFLVTVDEAHTQVDAWSSKRLPFEPTGTMLEFRSEVRRAVAGLSATPGHALHAAYASSVPGRFDVENVLLYNVGTSAFARSARHGLMVERRQGPVTDPPAAFMGAEHHHSYAIADNDTPWRDWATASPLASFESVEVDPATAGQASMIWFAIRRGMSSIHSSTNASSALGIELDIELPGDAHPNLAVFAKPLIDGVIAAFHTHDDPSSIDDVSARLATQLDAPVAEIRAMLTSSESALLGSRRLLWPWRSGVQWNPADDRCMAFRITRSSRDAARSSHHSVRIRGSLSELAPVAR